MTRLFLLLLFSADVENLSSPDFSTRERAETRLTYWGDLTYPLLDGKQKDREARRRADRIVDRTFGSSYSPLTLLLPYPLPEWGWWEYGDYRYTLGERPRDIPCNLTYLRTLDWKGKSIVGFRGFLVRHYGGKCRTQYEWMDWDSTADGREATKLLCQDMRKWGVHPYFIRVFLAHLRSREDSLANPAPAYP